MTTIKMSFTIPPEMAEAVKNKSKETSVPVSAAIQRLLAHWLLTGELPPTSELEAVARQATSKKEGKPSGRK